MSVSVSMPQLGESVTEGTVTRWLKKEGERVEVDEPLLEVSTDKVDTEIPSPASGILRSIAVDEDETVAVGAQLAVIEDSETSDSAPAQAGPPGQQGTSAPPDAQPIPGAPPQDTAKPEPAAAAPEPVPASSDGWSAPGSAPAAQTPGYAPPPAYGQPPSYGEPAAPAPAVPSQPYASPATQAPAAQSSPYAQPAAQVPSTPAPPPAAAAQPLAAATQAAAPAEAAAAPSSDQAADEEYPPPTPLPGTGEAPYVTPLVRKLAAEHAVNLETVSGTGVGGRIRKQDVIEAARAQRGSQATGSQAPPVSQDAPAAVVPQQAQRLADGPSAPAAQPAAPAARRPAVVPSSLRGTTQRMSRPRQVIAQRMVESLRTSAQLTTVVEADVTAIARLRDRAKADFEAREGVKLTFLPFFALAAVEALKVHPKLNAVINGDQVTYHDAEHLGVAVDTERGLMVPVIHNAGDLNIGGLARKIGDLAQRTRSGQVGPDELAGGTFTLTNTGSRGALFDTPIINQPQVAILGTGIVVRRPVVVEDPALGEVIAVRSMVYLALTYDHRLVDGADAARFLTTVKNRLEEGAFETELGL
jgi:pyruvate dehydrogenase E2 component (dihydrolipoamide acetyltransferase)